MESNKTEKSNIDSEHVEYSDAEVTQTGCSAPKMKKIHYNQVFNDDWLKDPNIKEWIACDPVDKCIVVCKVCNLKLVNTNRTGLIAHKNSTKHAKSLESKKNATMLQSFFKQPTGQDIDVKVAKAEIILSAFITEHNTLFAHVDHLVECMKAMFLDSAIALK